MNEHPTEIIAGLRSSSPRPPRRPRWGFVAFILCLALLGAAAGSLIGHLTNTITARDRQIVTLKHQLAAAKAKPPRVVIHQVIRRQVIHRIVNVPVPGPTVTTPSTGYALPSQDPIWQCWGDYIHAGNSGAGLSTYCKSVQPNGA